MSDLLVLVLAILGTAFFAGVEMALITVSKLRLNYWVEQGVRGAETAAEFLQAPRKIISLTMVGLNLTVILGSVIVARWVSQTFGLAGERLILSAILIPILAVPPFIVFGEILPKSLGREFASPILVWSLPLLQLLRYLLAPLTLLIYWSSEAMLRLLRVPTSPDREYFTRQNIEVILKEGALHGWVEPHEEAMISGVFKFRKLPVSQVMVPRQRVIALPRETDPHDLARIMWETRHSRIPLFQGSLNNVVGIIHFFDLLHTSPGEVPRLRLPVFLTPSRTCQEALFEMKTKRSPMAIIRDETGRTLGLVTLEDLVEELVGEIEEDHRAKWGGERGLPRLEGGPPSSGTMDSEGQE